MVLLVAIAGQQQRIKTLKEVFRSLRLMSQGLFCVNYDIPFDF